MTDIIDKIEYLKEFLLPERVRRIEEVLAGRTRYMTICAENTFHSQNASALLRTAEAMGVQDIHTIETLCKFRPNVDIVRGADKWLTMYHHHSTEEAISALRSSGYRIVATSVREGSTEPAGFDITAGKFALIFGTEHAGVSDEMMVAADEYIHIPMWGFVESLNLSASAAIIMERLRERLQASGIDYLLTEEERVPLLYNWLHSSVKAANEILEERFGK